jgi:hypothetical protein
VLIIFSGGTLYMLCMSFDGHACMAQTSFRPYHIPCHRAWAETLDGMGDHQMASTEAQNDDVTDDR